MEVSQVINQSRMNLNYLSPQSMKYIKLNKFHQNNYIKKDQIILITKVHMFSHQFRN